jgi:hypothetical protein
MTTSSPSNLPATHPFKTKLRHRPAERHQDKENHPKHHLLPIFNLPPPNFPSKNMSSLFLTPLLHPSKSSNPPPNLCCVPLVPCCCCCCCIDVVLPLPQIPALAFCLCISAKLTPLVWVAAFLAAAAEPPSRSANASPPVPFLAAVPMPRGFDAGLPRVAMVVEIGVEVPD